jgi:hypothetical protein
MIVATIANTTVAVFRDSPSSTDKVDEQTDFSFTVIDLAGTAVYTKNQPVTLTDTVDPTFIYSGFINNKPEATSLYPQPGRMWAIDCRDQTWCAQKRSTQKIYKNQQAGVILADMVQRVGSVEGLFCEVGLRWDELLTEWQAGTLTNTVATTNAGDGNAGDGDLELSLAGSTVSFSQATQADFNAGTTGGGLSALASGGVTFTPTQAIKFQATESVPGLAKASTYVKIWDKTISTYTIAATGLFPTLLYDIWIADTSPAMTMGIELSFTDGTLASGLTLIPDQQGLSCAPTTDLTGVAKNQWYRRSIPLYGNAVGKTLNYVALVFTGLTAGTYTCYYRNISIQNLAGGGTNLTIFGGAATATAITPTQLQDSGYSAMSCTVVTAYERTGFMFSPGFSLSAAVLAKSSYISWNIVLPTTNTSGFTFLCTASIDGFATFLPCTNNGAIPGLLPGMNLASKSVAFAYIMTSTGNDPTLTPFLALISGKVQPSYTCTKSDSITSVGAGSAFPSGTFTNLVNSSTNSLQLNGFARNWDNANYANQTLFGPASPAQGMSNQQFFLQTATAGDARSRIDVAGTFGDFTAECDVTVGISNTQMGIEYRTTNWQANLNTFAYCALLSTTQVRIDRGTNNASGTGTLTNVIAVSLSLTAGTSYRLKVVVAGTTHLVYVNDVLYITKTDATWTAAGYVGLRLFNTTGSTQTAVFDNFGVVASLSGTWVSPAIDIHALGTISNSALNLEIDPATNTTLCTFLAEISLNNGSTWTSLTNDVSMAGYYQATPVPGLTAGTNVSGMTQVKIRLTISASTAATGAAMPDITAITLFVIGAYSSSGFRVSPVISLAGVNRATSALVNWNDIQPTNTNLAVATSIDGATTWQSVVTAGTGITGITAQPAAAIDTFSTNTSANYTQSNFGGTTGTWTWDTANSRLTGSGGNGGTLVFTTALTGVDSLVSADFDQCDGSGLIANYASASAMYYVQIWDASGTGTQNSVKLFRRTGGVSTQIGSTAVISWIRGRYRRFILDVEQSTITVSMDGALLTTYSDSAVLAAGKSGLLLNTLVRCYNMRIQQYGQLLNMLSNGLLNSLTGWTTGGTNAGLISMVNNQCEMIFSNSPVASGFITQQTSLYSVVAGTKYYLNAIITGVSPVNVQYLLSVAWYSVSNTLLSTLAVIPASPPTTATLIATSGTAPATAVYAIVSIGASATNATNSGTVIFTNVDLGTVAPLQTQLTLTSTDPTATPQVLDLQAFVASSDIDPGKLIGVGNYNNTYLADNITDLNTQCATTWWYVRHDKSVVFRQRVATPSPWILDSANSGTYTNQTQGDVIVAGLDLTTSGDTYCNRVILNGVQGTGAFSETRNGNGSTRTWNLSNPLTAAPTILLNGQPQTVGPQGATGYQFYYLIGSATINQDASGTLLQGADTLSFPLYSGSFTTSVTRNNATPGTFTGTISQQEMAAIDKTSGIVESILDVSALNLNVAAAQSYGDEVLQKNGSIGARTLTFSTLRAGLAPGQQLTGFVPQQSCIDAQLLITQITTTAQIAPSTPQGVLYWRNVVASEGPALGSPWRMLNNLIGGS